MWKRLVFGVLAVVLLVGCATAPQTTGFISRESSCSYAQTAVALADVWLISSGGISPAAHKYWTVYRTGAVESIKLFCGN